ncbi:MAG: hypothetical protein R3A52_24105 [Polyangiales bacterium]
MLVEVVAERARGSVPVARSLLEAAGEHALQGRRHARAEPARWGVAVEADLLHHGAPGVFFEGAAAREELVEHDPEGEDVAPEVEPVAEHLLGRHVRGRAHHAEARVGLVDHLGEAEVGELHVAEARDQHVAGLEVAVQHPAQVGVLERAADLQRDHRGDVGRERSALAAAAQLREGPPLDELHHDEGRE